jgi:DNA-binding NtrC family response regulator
MSIYVLYANEDRPWAQQLATTLREADLPVWFAEDEIRIGESIPDVTSRAIESARVFLVVLSEKAAASNWFAHQLSGSLHQVLTDRTRRVMPVLREECTIPASLKDRRSLDLTNYEASVGMLVDELWELYKGIDPTAPDIPGYESFKYVGEGGFGIVYKCFSKDTSQECALKVAKMHSASLRIDGEVAAQLPESPYIVPIIRSGRWRDLPFVVMPFVGRSLKSAMRLGMVPQTNVDRILEIAEGILLGLADAHEAGIIHRDIKPSNILLDEIGKPLICDFGLSTKIQYTVFRYSTVVRGTVCYMSPEQQLALETNHQTDIYSFGAVFYELLTGEKPFGRFRDPSETNRRVPPAVDSLVSRCLEVSLDKRYSSARQVLSDLTSAKQTLDLSKRLRTTTTVRTPLFSSKVMKEATEELARLSALDLNCLILGPIGSGKTFLAEWSHRTSPRHREPFMVMSAAGVSEGLALAELFGYEKGAYTGATKRSIGLIGEANGGTLFVDDVDYLPHQVQVMFLRILDSGMSRAVGSTIERRVDVRFIFASNKDLFALARSGSFNPDLLSRMHSVIRVASLTERTDDIFPLINEFTERLGFRLEIGEDAERALKSHTWPGNVRELNQFVRFVARETDPAQRERGLLVLTRNLLKKFVEETSSVGTKFDDDIVDFSMPIMRNLRDSERDFRYLVANKVRQRTSSDDNAAKVLGLSPSTLRRHLKSGHRH